MKLPRWSFFGVLLIFAGLNACTQTNSVISYENPRTYFSTVVSLRVEVAYEPDAVPFTGTTAGGLNYWSILEDNLKAVFQARSQTVALTVPRELAAMTALSAQNRAVWTSSQILALADSTRKFRCTSVEADFIVLFLKGHLDNGQGAANTSVIGVSLSGTTVIAIFKDVVRASGMNPSGPVPKYVEQSTLVHEMGHALGLVNNGVPHSTAHHDSAHGAHCTSSQCVMNWVNEGASDLSTFVAQFIASGSTVMVGAECLKDIKDFQP